MRRSLLLLLAIAVPVVLLHSQITHNPQQQIHNANPEKEALIGLSESELLDMGLGGNNGEHSMPNTAVDNSRAEECFDAFIPVDQAVYTPVPRNDDGSLFIANLGFTFSFCGTSYTDVYVNTNGNLSFGQAVGQFSPNGFPFNIPMVAPFWADVDTRNVTCEQIWYQLFPNYLIVTWENVGWYNQQCSPLNTFQVIISDGTAPIIGIGNNVQFRYGDMEWTTGEASGGGPFGGFAATVGYNSGDNTNFEQIGRFNQDNSNYDGPLGADDGVHYLDFRCFAFDASGGDPNLTLECNDLVRALDASCLATITSDEIANALADGCSTIDLNIDLSSFGCNDIGPNIITVTATAGIQTETCTSVVDITQGACSTPSISQVGPFCNEDFPVSLNASPPGGSWSGAVSPTGLFDPEQTGPGVHTVNYTSPTSCPTTTTIDIVVNSSPQVSINPDPAEFCENDGGIPLTASAFGGDGNFTYSWTTPIGNQSGPTIPATFAGVYTVSITDGNGCSALAFTNVNVNPNPQVFIFDPGPICNTEIAFQLTASPTGGTWSGPFVSPEGFIFPQNMPPGITQVTYSFTNNFGCESSTTTDIEIVPSPDAIAQNNGPFCEGDAIQLFGNTNAPGLAIYNWTGPNGYTSNQQNPIDATEPGAYVLEVIVNGCPSDLAPTIVDVVASPDAVAANTGPYCPGQAISLVGGTSTNGNIISYEWSGPNGYFSNQQNPNDATDDGNYTLIVTVDGCPSTIASTDVVFTQAPTAIAVNTGPYCVGDNISLNGSTPSSGTTITYNWNGPNGYSSNQQNPIDATEAGIYDLVVDVDGCISDIASTTIVINQLPTPVIDGDASFCEGENSILDGGNGYSVYSWSTGESTQTISVSNSNTVGLTVTDANGCTGENSINITVNQNPEPSIAGSTTFCTGFSTILDAGNGYTTYEWSDGSANSTLEVSTGGPVSVTVTDANGCTGEASIDITESTSLNPTVSGDLEYCTGNNTLLDAGVGFETYAWSDGTNEQTINVDVPNDYSVTVTDINGCTGETTVSVVENQLPTVNITGNDPICTGEAVTLDAGNGFENYEWSDLSLNQSITVSTGGNYSVTVTDINGCTNEAAVMVTENPNPEPTITGDAAFCNGESVILDGGTFDQYVWSEGSTSATIEINSGDTYALTVTDVNGCTGEDQFVVTENQLPMPQIDGDFEFCEGASTLLQAPNGFDYQWSNGETTQAVSINLDGPIGLTVTDANGCTGETSEMLTINQNPEPTIAGSATFCIGNSTILDAGVYDQYIWSDGGTNQTLEVNIEGDYSVTVTDGNGCTGITQINVTENESLQPVIAGDSDICAGEASILDAGAGFETYTWSNGEVTQTITVDTEDDYSVTVSDVQGCTGETSLAFIVNQNPLANINGIDVFCEGESSTLDAGNGYSSYQWSNGEISQTIEVATSDIYSVTIIDGNGCEDEAQVEVTVNPLPVPQISGPSSFCSGNSASLDAGTGFESYFWSNGETSQSITVDVGNVYSVTVTSFEGCSAETSVDVIENSSLTPIIVGDLEFCEGDNSILDAGTGFATYEWSGGETSQTITVTENGNYGVIVTDADGCSGSTNVAVTTFQNPEPIIAGSTTFCTGSFTTLDAGNYESYMWSDGSANPTLEVNTPGIYTVDVIDVNGCPGTATIDVTESTSLNPVISGSTAFCTNGSTILDAGTGFASYIWSDGSTDQTLEVFASTDYSVTVSDAQGCTGETTIFVTENTPPSATLIQGPELCNTDAGGSITNLYDLIVAGDDTGTWEDTDNSGALGLFNNLNFNGIPAGVYTFTYTTNSAVTPCAEVSYPVSITINDCTCPNISFNAVDPLCNNTGSIDLNNVLNSSEPGSWSISSSPGGSNPAIVNGSIFEATNGDAGTYDIEFSLLNTPPPGCPQFFNISIDVENEVHAGLANAPIEFCEDESQIVTLDDLLEGEEPGGIWTEVSGIPSQNGAFDPAIGAFNMSGQNDGTYTFEYTISPGGACPDDSEIVTVMVNELPTAVAGASIELNCTTPVLSLNGTGSSSGAQFDVQWTGGVLVDGNENTLSPTVDQAGSYTLIITNSQTGCSATDAVMVTESSDIPTAFAGNDDTLTCDDEEVSLQPGGDIGAGFMVEWQGPAISTDNMNEINPLVDIAGTYIIVVTNTDNGCVSAPDTVIISNDDDAPNFIIETPLSLDCNITSTALVSSANGTDLSFEWFDDNNVSIGNDPVIGGITEPGEYILVVTNNLTGCSGSEAIEVFENVVFPTALANTPDILNCYDPETTLDGSASQGGANIVYNWSGPGINGDPTSIITSANLAGMYILSVLDNNNGCESFDTVMVDQDITPPNAIVGQPDLLDCTVTEVTLDGSASSSGSNFVYSWLNPNGNVISTDNNVLVEEIGTYALAIQNTSNGCVDTTLINVLQNEDVPSSAFFIIENPDCYGDDDGNIALIEVQGGMAPYVFSLDGETYTNTAFYTGLTPGSYNIALQDANGCEWDTTINIVEPIEIDLDLGGNIELVIGDSAIVQAEINIPMSNVDTIIWNSTANVIECGDPDCLEVGFSSFATETVSATLIDINGCVSEDQISVIMNRDKHVFIPNAFTPNDDGENDRFIIFADEEQVVQINKFIVFNRWGEIVYEGLNFQPNDPDYGWDGKFRSEMMNPAVFVYLAEIEFIDGEVLLFKGDVTLIR